jgi:hypothetical protein
MALSVIAANITTKISAAISATATNNGSNDTDTLHTVAASSYAIVQIYRDAGSAGATFKINGTAFLTMGGSVAATTTNVYLGPSQVLSVTWAGLTTGTNAYVSGVEFINSP